MLRSIVGPDVEASTTTSILSAAVAGAATLAYVSTAPATRRRMLDRAHIRCAETSSDRMVAVILRRDRRIEPLFLRNQSAPGAGRVPAVSRDVSAALSAICYSRATRLRHCSADA